MWPVTLGCGYAHDTQHQCKQGGSHQNSLKKRNSLAAKRPTPPFTFCTTVTPTQTYFKDSVQ